VWSTDDSKIAFLSYGPDGGYLKVYTYEFASGTVTEVTPSKDEENPYGDIYRMWWSGSAITYDRYPFAIQTFVPDALNPQEAGHSNYQVIVPAPFNEEVGMPVEPAWSPDGTKLAFTKGAFYEPSDTLAIFIPSIGVMVALDQLVTNASWPAWSPDGKKIAFVHDVNGNSDIWVTSLPELPTASRLSGTWAGYEFRRGFSGGDTSSWGNVTDQELTKIIFSDLRLCRRSLNF